MVDDKYKFWWPKDPPTKGTHFIHYCPNVLKWITMDFHTGAYIKRIYTSTGILIAEVELEHPTGLTGFKPENTAIDKNGNTYLYYNNLYNGGIVKYSLFGELKWIAPLEFDVGTKRAGQNTIQISDDGNVFVQNPNLVAIDGKTGEIMWTVGEGITVYNKSLPAVVGNRVFWGINGKLWLIDAKTGEIIKTTNIPFYNSSYYIRKGAENDICDKKYVLGPKYFIRRYTYNGDLGCEIEIAGYFSDDPYIAISKVDSRIAFARSVGEDFYNYEDNIECYDKNGNLIWSYYLGPEYRYPNVINFDSANRLLVEVFHRPFYSILFSPNGEVEWESEISFPLGFDWWNAEKSPPSALMKEYGRESLYNSYSFSEKRHKKMRGE